MVANLGLGHLVCHVMGHFGRVQSRITIFFQICEKDFLYLLPL